MEQSTNVIAESLYTQSDAEENEYSIMDSLINYFKDDNAL